MNLEVEEKKEYDKSKITEEENNDYTDENERTDIMLAALGALSNLFIEMIFDFCIILGWKFDSLLFSKLLEGVDFDFVLIWLEIKSDFDTTSLFEIILLFKLEIWFRFDEEAGVGKEAE